MTSEEQIDTANEIEEADVEPSTNYFDFEVAEFDLPESDFTGRMEQMQNDFNELFKF